MNEKCIEISASEQEQNILQLTRIHNISQPTAALDESRWWILGPRKPQKTPRDASMYGTLRKSHSHPGFSEICQNGRNSWTYAPLIPEEEAAKSLWTIKNIKSSEDANCKKCLYTELALEHTSQRN